MHLKKLLNRIPDRVRIGVGGIALAFLFLAGPRLLAEWIRFWS